MKIVLTYSELRALLAPVIPHAATDDMLPSICQIPIAESNGFLVAQATDRFTAAFKRIKPNTPAPEGFATSFATADARRLLSLLKPGRGSDPEIEIEPTDTGDVKVTSKSGGFSLGFTELRLAFPSPDLFSSSNSFPDMGGLLPKSCDNAVSFGGFNLRFLARFNIAIEVEFGDNNSAAGLRFGDSPNKPLLVSVGQDFLGLIMPRRLIGEGVSTGDPTPAVVESFRAIVPRFGAKAPSSERVPETAGASA